MKYFLVKLLLLSLPITLFFVFPFVVLLYGREYTKAATIVATQKKFPNAIFSFAYVGGSFIPYKEVLVREQDPYILALGSSRIMQLREEFFKQKFTNAGGAGKTLRDIELFIQNLPEDSHTKVIIVGLDQEFFYEPEDKAESRQEASVPVKALDTLSLMSRRIYLDYVSGKFSFTDLRAASQNLPHIGLSALIYGDGFRKDGSYRYARIQKEENRESSVRILAEDQATNIAQALTARDLSRFADNLDTLKRIIDLARQEGMTIIGFSPPYPQPVYAAMASSSGKSKHMVIDAPQKIAALFQGVGAHYENMADPLLFGGKGYEYVDAIHGTDVMYAKLLMRLADSDPALKAMLDDTYLKEAVKRRDAFLPD